jgi:hypothetical protein
LRIINHLNYLNDQYDIASSDDDASSGYDNNFYVDDLNHLDFNQYVIYVIYVIYDNIDNYLNYFDHINFDNEHNNCYAHGDVHIHLKLDFNLDFNPIINIKFNVVNELPEAQDERLVDEVVEQLAVELRHGGLTLQRRDALELREEGDGASAQLREEEEHQQHDAEANAAEQIDHRGQRATHVRQRTAGHRGFGRRGGRVHRVFHGRSETPARFEGHPAGSHG